MTKRLGLLTAGFAIALSGCGSSQAAPDDPNDPHLTSNVAKTQPELHSNDGRTVAPPSPSTSASPSASATTNP